MQALAVVGPQVGLAGLLVVPRLVGRAGFHRREDRDQPGVLPSLGQHRVDQLLFADIFLAQVFDRDAVLGCQSLRVLP